MVTCISLRRKTYLKTTTATVVVALIAIALSVSVQAAPPQQARPECSIEDRDFGNPIESDGSELVTPLQTLRVTCDVSDNSREVAWNFSTELLNPKWSVSDAAGRHPPVFEQIINLEDYSDRLEIELTGNVAWPKVPGQFGSEEATYVAETAPGTRTRVVSFSGQSGGPPVHYEVIAVHPDHLKVLQAIGALEDRDLSVVEYVRPIREAANTALEEGRPWRAIELIETMNPVLDIATEHRLEYEELRLDSQAFVTPKLIIGLVIGIVTTLGVAGLVALVLVIKNSVTNRNRRDASDDGSEAGDASAEAETAAPRRRRRRRRST